MYLVVYITFLQGKKIHADDVELSKTHLSNVI